MTSARPGRKPFYVHIATLFILLFTLLGSALIALQFQQAAQQGLEHERQNFLQYREQLALALQLNERPARMSLSLLRSGQLAAMNSLDARLGYLPQLAEVLANSPSYGAVYAGYADGDFFLVRKLTERARAQLDRVPAASTLLVQSLHQGKGEFLYFDQRLTLLERRAMPQYQFDPRSRDWYKQARWRSGIATTHPYLFFTTKEPGMTLAVESDNRRAVIGLDTSVEGLSALIGELRLPEQSQVVLFDEYATLLATDPKQLPSFEQLSQLPLLSALSHPVLTQLQQQVTSQPALLSSPVELNLTAADQSDWLVNLSPLGEGSPFYIALLVSADLLYQQARNEALINLGWALAGLLLLLPVIWLVSRRTAPPPAGPDSRGGADPALRLRREPGAGIGDPRDRRSGPYHVRHATDPGQLYEHGPGTGGGTPLRLPAQSHTARDHSRRAGRGGLPLPGARAEHGGSPGALAATAFACRPSSLAGGAARQAGSWRAAHPGRRRTGLAATSGELGPLPRRLPAGRRATVQS